MGFNSAFKGLMTGIHIQAGVVLCQGYVPEKLL
jgi:hypothetical protein